MRELGLIILSTALVNNFVLSKYLGLCPLMGVSQRMTHALGMCMATTFVLTLTALLSHLLYFYVLQPLGLEVLQIIVFIFTIAALVQFSEQIIASQSPWLHQVLGLYLPLITTNCAVLGMALLSVRQPLNAIGAFFFGLGSALGFSLVLIVFTSLREHLQQQAIPACLRGAPIALITAGVLAMIFLGFSGFTPPLEQLS